MGLFFALDTVSHVRRPVSELKSPSHLAGLILHEEVDEGARLRRHMS